MNGSHSHHNSSKMKSFRERSTSYESNSIYEVDENGNVEYTLKRCFYSDEPSSCHDVKQASDSHTQPPMDRSVDVIDDYSLKAPSSRSLSFASDTKVLNRSIEENGEPDHHNVFITPTRNSGRHDWLPYSTELERNSMSDSYYMEGIELGLSDARGSRQRNESSTSSHAPSFLNSSYHGSISDILTPEDDNNMYVDHSAFESGYENARLTSTSEAIREESAHNTTPRVRNSRTSSFQFPSWLRHSPPIIKGVIITSILLFFCTLLLVLSTIAINLYSNKMKNRTANLTSSNNISDENNFNKNNSAYPTKSPSLSPLYQYNNSSSSPHDFGYSATAKPSIKKGNKIGSSFDTNKPTSPSKSKLDASLPTSTTSNTASSNLTAIIEASFNYKPSTRPTSVYDRDSTLKTENPTMQARPVQSLSSLTPSRNVSKSFDSSSKKPSTRPTFFYPAESTSKTTYTISSKASTHLSSSAPTRNLWKNSVSSSNKPSIRPTLFYLAASISKTSNPIPPKAPTLKPSKSNSMSMYRKSSVPNSLPLALTLLPTAREHTTSAFYAISRRYDNVANFTSLLKSLPSNEAFAMFHLGNWNDPSANLCTNETYIKFSQSYKASPIPVMFLPGDLDWDNCPNRTLAGQYWKKYLRDYSTNNTDSKIVKVETQSTVEKLMTNASSIVVEYDTEFRDENFCFSYDKTLFIGIHFVGGGQSQQNNQNLKWITDRISLNKNSTEIVVILANSGPSTSSLSLSPTFTNEPFFMGLRELVVKLNSEVVNTQLNRIRVLPFVFIHESNAAWGVVPKFMGVSRLTRVHIQANKWPPMRVGLDRIHNTIVFNQDDWLTAV